MNVKDPVKYQAWIEQCRLRRAKMQKLRKAGHSFGMIATKFGVTRQRVQQILKND